MKDQRTWVFVANRIMTEQEVDAIQEALESFVSSWKTHGTPIQANGFCFQRASIVIAANEKEVKASGCSIDKIMHTIRAIGEDVGIDFFDRFNVLCKNDNGDWILDRYHLGNASTSINSMIVSLMEFNKKAGE